jgi:hypothetical protein
MKLATTFILGTILIRIGLQGRIGSFLAAFIDPEALVES